MRLNPLSFCVQYPVDNLKYLVRIVVDLLENSITFLKLSFCCCIANTMSSSSSLDNFFFYLSAFLTVASSGSFSVNSVANLVTSSSMKSKSCSDATKSSSATCPSCYMKLTARTVYSDPSVSFRRCGLGLDTKELNRSNFSFEVLAESNASLSLTMLVFGDVTWLPPGPPNTPL